MRVFLITGLVCLLVALDYGAKEIDRLEFVPTELSSSRGEKITVDMARLKVPENRSKPGSRTIELAVVRLKSKAANPSAPVVYLAGGPGGSAINEGRFPWLRDLFGKLQETRDVILMDQRGTGRSTPLVYWKSPVSLPADAFLSKEKMLSHYRQGSVLALEFFKNEGIDLKGYNSVESADDLNDLRIALGVNKLSLLGYSYGTHLALAALRRHAESIDSVVLIGTEGPNHTAKLPSTYDTQLRKLSDLAAQDPEVGGKVPNMFELLKTILARLEKEPITVKVEDQRTGAKVDALVGKFGLQLIVRIDVGDRNDFPGFPALFYAIHKGDYSLLAKYIEKRFNQFGRGISGMGVMMDLASGATAERRARIHKESQSGILGDVVNFPDVDTDLWGNPDLGDDYRSPLVATTRSLFISGTLDSNTPPYQAEEVRWGFPNSDHLIVEYAGHEDYLPNEEVRSAIVDFFSGKAVGDIRISMGRPKFKPIPE